MISICTSAFGFTADYVVLLDVGSIVRWGMDRYVEGICVEELFVLEV